MQKNVLYPQLIYLDTNAKKPAQAPQQFVADQVFGLKVSMPPSCCVVWPNRN
jgi:hypothetical protein